MQWVVRLVQTYSIVVLGFHKSEEDKPVYNKVFNQIMHSLVKYAVATYAVDFPRS
jgi:hypothetical protein